MSAQAQALEAQGALEAALEAYLADGDSVAAARIAARLLDFERAAMLLLRGLKVGPGRRLNPQEHQRAFCAAMFLGQAGRVREAIELMVNLGERQRAAELMRSAGAPKPGEQLHGALDEAEVTRLASQARGRALERRGDLASALKAYLEGDAQAEAGRVAEALGRAGQAAEIYERAGLYFSAARCHRAHGEDAAAWACLCRVSADDPRYEDALEVAIELAEARGALDFRFEQFVGPFVQAPVEEDRVDRLVALARVYEQHGLIESAQEICQALYRGGFKKAARGLRSARAVSGLSGAPPELPDLPQLPDMFLSELPEESSEASNVLPSLPQMPRLGPSTKRLSQASSSLPLIEAWDTGATIADRYLLGARLGRGGMATVFLADDLQLGEKVAIKVFERNTDLEMLERFKREVRLTRRVHDPNVIQVYDVGSVHGVWFITMEYLQGQVLSRVIGRRLSLKKMLWLLAQAARGLASAHEHAIVHRDVKPSNLFVTSKGVLKVMDFGIAKALGENDHTATGRIVGTPKYMSPEQISGFSKVTPQADVYSLGVVAYEMFTGVVPFSHPDTLPILMMQLTAKPEPPSLKNERIPKALEALIMSMLIKEPKRRIDGARRVAERAREIFKGLP